MSTIPTVTGACRIILGDTIFANLQTELSLPMIANIAAIRAFIDTPAIDGRHRRAYEYLRKALIELNNGECWQPNT